VLVLNWRDPWHPEGGGSELYVSEVARRLSAAGTDVTVFSASYPGAASSETRDGIGYRRRGGHLTVYLWAALMLLSRRFGRLDAVLEVQNGMPFLARLFTRARVVVLVHHVHREQWSILRPLLARFGWFMESRVAVRVNQGTPYVAVSEVTRSELVALGVRAQDITIAWNGQPAPPDFEPPGPATTPRLVVLSRLVPHKRVEHALEAVAALRDEIPGLHLRVMGSGWWSEHLLERRRELGLDDVVTLLGHVTDLEKFRELSSAWVHVLPSVKEGWGLSIVEAAQMGVPSVAYADAGGVRRRHRPPGHRPGRPGGQAPAAPGRRRPPHRARHQGPDPVRAVLLGRDGRRHRGSTGDAIAATVATPLALTDEAAAQPIGVGAPRATSVRHIPAAPPAIERVTQARTRPTCPVTPK
jgi:glycosyltransferase involved in cell wall biosynthesis